MGRIRVIIFIKTNQQVVAKRSQIKTDDYRKFKKVERVCEHSANRK
jgi:hypothetical protein